MSLNNQHHLGNKGVKMDKFELKELSEFMGVPIIENAAVKKVAVDSRLCEENTVFFALKGDKKDGHKFLKQAYVNKAIAAVVSKDYDGDDFGLQLLKTENPLEILQSFSQKILKIRSPLVIGITGSVGKTTTKEFISTILKNKFSLSKTINSYNGQIGLPLSILNASPSAEILILEYGMSKKNEMKKLVDIAPPHIAVMTPISQVHIGHFESVEEIAEEKAYMMHSSYLKLAIIHELSNQLAPIAALKGLKKITYGLQNADCKIFCENKQMIVMSQEGEKVQFNFPDIATHHLENFLPAFILAKNMHMPLSEIQEAVSHLKSYDHRFQKIKSKGITIIDDTYNSNPYALKKSLESIPQPAKGSKKIAVLGEMKELGRFSKELHEDLGRYALRFVDKLICVGEETKPLYEEFNKIKEAVYFDLKKDAVDFLKRMLRSGDVILIKGSNSNKLWEVVQELKK